MREIEVLRRINHPGIVTMKKDFDISCYKVIVLERIYNGELFELVEKFGNTLRATVVDRLMAELCGCIDWLHSIGLIHQDLKLENILMTREIKNTIEEQENLLTDRSPILKLTDFGLSRFMNSPSERFSTRCGSEEYVSPEIILSMGSGSTQKTYDPRLSELWSIGVIGFSLIRGELPFVVRYDSLRRQSLMKIIKVDIDWKSIQDEEELLNPGQSPRMKQIELVKGLIRREPEQRLRIDLNRKTGETKDVRDNVWKVFPNLARLSSIVSEFNRNAKFT
ncbi:kinase-like domain-containing protein [Phakopsora pachyrhizi]|nr:kinase-like domain-containing protein [Phakopsora pachyrhizi]